MGWFINLFRRRSTSSTSNDSYYKKQNAKLQAENADLYSEVEQLKAMSKIKGIKTAKKLGSISVQSMSTLLKPYCNQVFLSDKTFSLTSIEEAKKYSVSTKVAMKKYKTGQYDCDEFSFALQGYWNLDLYQFAFGIAWNAKHAFNIMVDNKKNIYIVEPQTNKFIPIKIAMKNSMYGPLRLILI